ncbi:hypothetical protein L486_04349 [Kwoniella mangroviensis CBS 10435]|uniref:CUE domain-containing protein n=1 Tax=Kwoniella mangroviensis CBS 10435 TaxID=1331196 RepID=A0A1B9IRZ3_9TREE|nr:uncharacterized protein I203_02559 [Kwoniella mangroviensis CBS 8507]OCF58318.1 hypothetical protein L486_04349 [Kwoniella mangroviensis CBS 10435]OCF67901.1 hypothetical protein I203_02559 [Kwoniella mangroviensis CBS 8507]
MEDIIPTIIIIAAIYFLVRWITGSKSGNNTQGGIRGVTPSMVDTIHGAFPHVPLPNIIYSLSRTRSAQATSEEILERGTLPTPPPNFQIPASLLPSTPPSSTTTTTTNTPSSNNGKSQNAKNSSLIDRYNLSSRIPTPSHKGKEKELPDEVDSGASTPVSISETEGKKHWEDTREKREMGLRERKEKMILEARRRMLEKQAQAQAQNTNSTTA